MYLECTLSIPEVQYRPKTTRQHIDFIGAVERSRTSDLLITNQLLYQLSYNGAVRLTCEGRKYTENAAAGKGREDGMLVAREA